MAGTQSPRGGILSMHDQTKIKRRDLRKGTHSCWECKRRKMRCVVETNAHGTTCQGCRRRGTPCISQEIPEEVAFRIINARETGNAIDSAFELPSGTPRVGDSIILASTNKTVNDPPTPTSTASRPSQASTVTPLEYDASYVLTSEWNLETISQRLYEALPLLEDVEKIYNARPLPDVSAHELMTMPYTTLSQNDMETVPSLTTDAVDPQWHPVLIARHMLMLASSLQHLHPNIHPEIKGLSETPQVISERLSRLANHYVTSKDEMLGSIEALECILIESVYQANLGNLRQSWIVARRALSIAQLMGLDQNDRRAQYQVLDTRRSHDPRIIWHRIVFLDRFLCVMLSLPAACPDSCWNPDTVLSSDSSKGRRLERIHCMVASRILESSRRTEFSTIDRQKIQDLDSELQKAARSLPTRWWLIPRLDASQADPRTIFWNTGRIFAQVLHYNLIYRLHLPYMFRSSPMDRTYEYSRVTCVNASREILTRFLALRNFNGIASSCRIIDFIALMASLTLLLSHLHSQVSVTENLLAHQYHSDRAIIEQVQETMEESDQLKSDPLGARSADLLRRLMAIDIYEGDGFLRPANNVSVHPEADSADNDDENSVSIQIPYFGLVKIARDSTLNLSFQHSETCLPFSVRKTGVPGSSYTMDIEAFSHQTRTKKGDASGYHNHEVLLDASTDLAVGPIEPAALPMSNSPSRTFPDRVTQHEIYPSLAADIEGWAFQGVDLAFFNTILQSTENNGANPEGE